MGVIYSITNKIDGKTYIGLDRFGFQRRWKDHLRHAKEGHAVQLIDRKIAEYGEENFMYSELYETNNVEELKSKEQFYIKQFGCYVGSGKGYNLTLGGDGSVGFKMPLDKIHKGENHYMFGKKQTVETNMKRREAMKKVRATTINPFTMPNVRQKISQLAKARIGELNTNFRHGRRINGKNDVEYTAHYYQQHKDKIKAKAKKQYLLNREKEIERAGLYRLTHKKVKGYWLKR